MDIFVQLTAICFVLGILAFGSWWVRRAGFATPKQRTCQKLLQSVERLPLSPHLAIHLVQIGERRVAFAVHNSGVTVLDRLPAAAPKHFEAQRVRPAPTIGRETVLSRTPSCACSLEEVAQI